MQVNDQKIELGKNISWYLFLLSNVMILIGCVIMWSLIWNDTPRKIDLPIIICNLLSIGIMILFLWIEIKNTLPKLAHFQKKWLWWYLAAIIVFLIAIIFNFSFFYFAIRNNNETQAIHSLNKNNWQFITHFVVIGVLTLISISLQRYAKFKIDLDVYRRKHGQNPNEKNNKKLN